MSSAAAAAAAALVLVDAAINSRLSVVLTQSVMQPEPF